VKNNYGIPQGPTVQLSIFLKTRTNSPLLVHSVGKKKRVRGIDKNKNKSINK
jgi:hypothetical protein